jgi:dTDP-4-dehydrorhamnose 3,5-epimerase-like enzyme
MRIAKTPPACLPIREEVGASLKGALWDVVVDLRTGSPTYLKSFGAELTEDNRSMLYIPRGSDTSSR